MKKKVNKSNNKSNNKKIKKDKNNVDNNEEDIEDRYEVDENINNEVSSSECSNQSFYSRLLNRYSFIDQPLLFDTIVNKSQQPQQQKRTRQSNNNERIIIQDIVKQFHRRHQNTIKKHNEGIRLPRHHNHLDRRNRQEDSNIEDDSDYDDDYYFDEYDETSDTFDTDYDSNTIDSDFDDSSSTSNHHHQPLISQNNQFMLEFGNFGQIDNNNNNHLLELESMERKIKRDLKRKRKEPQTILKSTRMVYGLLNTCPTFQLVKEKDKGEENEEKEDEEMNIEPPILLLTSSSCPVIPPLNINQPTSTTTSTTTTNSIIPKIKQSWNISQQPQPQQQQSQQQQSHTQDNQNNNNLIITNIKHDKDKYKEQMVEMRAMHSTLRRVVLDLASKNQIEILQDPCSLWAHFTSLPEFKVFGGCTAKNNIKTGLYLTEVLITLMNQPEDLEEQQQLEEEQIEMEEFLNQDEWNIDDRQEFGNDDKTIKTQLEEEDEEDDDKEGSGGWDLNQSKLVPLKEWKKEERKSEEQLEDERMGCLDAMKSGDQTIPPIFNSSGMIDLFSNTLDSVPTHESLGMIVRDLKDYLRPIIADLVSTDHSQLITRQRVVWSIQTTNSNPITNNTTNSDWYPTKQYFNLFKQTEEKPHPFIDFYQLAKEKEKLLHFQNNEELEMDNDFEEENSSIDSSDDDEPTKPKPKQETKPNRNYKAPPPPLPPSSSESSPSNELPPIFPPPPSKPTGHSRILLHNNYSKYTKQQQQNNNNNNKTKME
ncbi:hypothetical protein DFA_10394 [Cavenderia fasciculata]|uniref:Uncharacterized protein n=1 Tax=Cavenderia fasciculata TaxID=261658 RepID=F4QA33_CACFS|nr:uncharacterized protein DFA_10394 [Cavenderia fasciculata]EGG15552.1 hypothetical protein DFA_10394 [Cavenderia fasciculata]|eukprot:XP_004354294.1 hypothetical protein DFA_10394 [Cavenderia fasciculata]